MKGKLSDNLPWPATILYLAVGTLTIDSSQSRLLDLGVSSMLLKIMFFVGAATALITWAKNNLWTRAITTSIIVFIFAVGIIPALEEPDFYAVVARVFMLSLIIFTLPVAPSRRK